MKQVLIAVHFFAFRRFAHAFFIAIDIFDLNSTSSADGVTAARIALFFVVFDAAAAAFSAWNFAHRALVASEIALRPAADIPSFFFAGAFGLTQSGMVGSS